MNLKLSNMDAIVFLGETFSVKNYQSIECKNIREVDESLRKNKNVKFLILHEENFGVKIDFPVDNKKPLVIYLTKDYGLYRKYKFTPILLSKRLAQMMIEQWLS